MKKYIKNVTDDNKTVVPYLGRPYTPCTLSFRENGQLVILKPGEYIETKRDGTNLAGDYVNGKKVYRRLHLLTEEELGEKPNKKKKKEVKNDN